MIKEIKANKVSYGKHISKCSCVTFTKELFAQNHKFNLYFVQC